MSSPPNPLLPSPSAQSHNALVPLPPLTADSMLYTLSTLESDRAQVQVIHEQDDCCFHGCGRHDRIREYNTRVRAQAAGAFQTVVTQGGVHEVNPRDKIVIGLLADQLRTRGVVTRADTAALPYNTLNEW